MKKRITLSLDENLAEALQARGARSLSAAANDALREAIAEDAQRAALHAWLDELDAVRGAPHRRTGVTNAPVSLRHP